jgi:hypothetical protein
MIFKVMEFQRRRDEGIAPYAQGPRIARFVFPLIVRFTVLPDLT